MILLLNSLSKPFIRERTMMSVMTPTNVPPTAMPVTRETNPLLRFVFK